MRPTPISPVDGAPDPTVQPPTQPNLPLPPPGVFDRSADKAPSREGRLRPSLGTTMVAIGSIACIVFTQNQFGVFDEASLIFAASLGGSALVLSIILAFMVFRHTDRSRSAANAAFVVAMVLFSGAAMLVRGPVRDLTATRLTNGWAASGEDLTKIGQLPAVPAPKAHAPAPTGPNMGNTASADPTNAPAVKGAPVVRVYRRQHANGEADKNH